MRELVSLTQIRDFDKKLNFVVTKANKSKMYNAKIFYYLSKGCGMLRFGHGNATPKEGEHELFNVDDFKKLLDGYLDYRALNNKHKDHVSKKEAKEGIEKYLYMNINNKVVTYLKTIPLEPEIIKLYENVNNFKKVYTEVAKIPKSVSVDFNEFGFDEKEYAISSVNELLSGVAQEHGLKLKDVSFTDGTVIYSIEGTHNKLQRSPVVVYKKALKSFCPIETEDDKRFVEYAGLLYNATKEDFIRTLINGNYYKEMSAFIGELDKDARSINVDGLKDWYDYANKLTTSKTQLTDFVKGE